jgi:hypothetical protein
LGKNQTICSKNISNILMVSITHGISFTLYIFSIQYFFKYNTVILLYHGLLSKVSIIGGQTRSKSSSEKPQTSTYHKCEILCYFDRIMKFHIILLHPVEDGYILCPMYPNGTCYFPIHHLVQISVIRRTGKTYE